MAKERQPCTVSQENDMRVSVVIPVFQDKGIVQTVRSLLEHFRARQAEFEIILVRDGGSEDIQTIIATAANMDSDIRVINRSKNYGKGYSVREGLATATGDILVYTDADLPYDLNSMQTMIEAVGSGSTDLALARRRYAPGDKAKEPKLRILMHHVFTWLVKCFFRIPSSDTQAGLKAISSTAKTAILPYLSIDRYCFDVELICAAQDAKFRICEFPATLRMTEGTNIRLFSDSWKMIVDLLRIRRNRQSRNPDQTMSRATIAALIVAVALFLGFGLFHLQTSPAPWFDDGSAMALAKSVAEHGVYGMQIAPGQFDTEPYWLTIQHPVTIPVAIAFTIFGSSILVARMVMLVYLAGLVGMAFLLIRRIGNSYIATWSVWLLVTFSPLYGNGKAMLGETPGIFWMLVGTWFWIQAREQTDRRRIKSLILSGIGFGLCVITKPYYLLLLPALLIARIFEITREKRMYTAQELAFWLPMSALGIFWLVQIMPKPISIEHAMTVVGFFTNSYGVAITGNTMLQNALRFATESTPMHCTILLFVCTMAAIKIKPRSWNPALVQIGVFILLSIFWYLKTPGWYRYFYSIHLLLIIFTPLALWKSTWPKIPNWIKGSALVGLIALQIGITVKNLDTYRSDSLFALRNAVYELVPDRQIFLAHVPEAAFILPSSVVSQAIYINPSLTVGTNVLLESASSHPNLVITALPGAVGVDAIEPILQSEYRPLWTGGHYRLLEKISPSL